VATTAPSTSTDLVRELSQLSRDDAAFAGGKGAPPSPAGLRAHMRSRTIVRAHDPEGDRD
jgi:hypothetical protein